MRLIIGLLFTGFFFLMDTSNGQSFREQQKKNPRVKEAYENCFDEVKSWLAEAGLNTHGFEMYIRVFKNENQLEVWGKNPDHKKFSLIHVFPVCYMSGDLGPKRKEGDRQVPEGFYFVNHFNPASTYHLSLGINYPNVSDKILSDQTKPGGQIYIHGSCVSIGCVAIRDARIEQLYVLAVEARNNGQKEIPVHIFPCRIDTEAMQQLTQKFKEDFERQNFWKDIQPAYLYFEQHRTLPAIRYLRDGTHSINDIQ